MASQSTTLTPIEVHDTHVQMHSPTKLSNEIKLDIEHAVVVDDPRLWSDAKKNVILCIISGASMIAGLSSNIQNPANAQMQQQLHTSSGGISLSLSLYILLQGNVPFIWSAISEIKGRKLVYIFSIALYTIASAIVAISRNIGLVIGMRILQGAGSSAVFAIGAATLADIYEPHERGTMMGIYNSAPVLGPSLGAIIGGALTQGLDWRAVFWFLAIWGGVIIVAFIFFFEDTFRKERSLIYQNVLDRRARDQLSSKAKGESQEVSEELKEDAGNKKSTNSNDVEAQQTVIPISAINEVELSIVDVNPFPAFISVLRRKNNIAVLLVSGLMFGFGYSISYTCARTLEIYYKYNALNTGLVLLAYGIGCLAGSTLGGRWSDRTLARLKAANGGISFPEMRLESTKVSMVFLPLSVIGYAWTCQERVNIAAVCVMLFLSGFFSIWVYSSTLAYIVDANVGCASTAVAANSSFRGLLAFTAAEIAVPLQDALGDGGLYTFWAFMMVVIECLVLLVLYKGRKWRETSIEREERRG